MRCSYSFTHLLICIRVFCLFSPRVVQAIEFLDAKNIFRQLHTDYFRRRQGQKITAPICPKIP